MEELLSKKTMEYLSKLLQDHYNNNFTYKFIQKKDKIIVESINHNIGNRKKVIMNKKNTKMYYKKNNNWENIDIDFYNNFYYNKDNGLEELSNYRYAVNFIFFDNDKEKFIILIGNNNFTMKEAIYYNDIIVMPKEITDKYILISKIVVQKNSKEPVFIEIKNDFWENYMNKKIFPIECNYENYNMR